MNIRFLRFVPLFVIAFVLACNPPQKPVTNSPAPSSNTYPSLTGTEWVLADLAGTPVIANSKASIAFPEGGRVAGNGSCNRFTGAVTISGDTLTFGPLASTRVACMDGSVSSQEDRYFKLLGTAKRFELKDGSLLIYAEGSDKPLRFTRQIAPTP